ncbi:uncharacterized protein LOC116945426 isoform X5 [Petromyzon marinus]|uniref:uncharacterized protein LOC116945426 isoform X5 n=1 Tax=Petromyzon marinus TaxID=7757 RepID=UPI003F6EC9D7
MRFMATVENNSFIKGSRQTLGTSFHLQAMQNNSGRLTRCTSADYNSIKALLDAFKYGTPRRTTTGRTGHSGQSSLWGGTRSSGSHLWTLGSSSHLVQAMNKIWKEKQRTTQMRLAPSYSAGNMGYSKWTVHQRRNALSCWSNGENWCKVPLAPK